jgi:glycosyltransferase involved in cell wall biosynthesis
MPGRSVPVFCYHAVCKEDGHSPEVFASHLDAMLEMGYRTITARHLYEICMGRRPVDGKYVVLTFDDCHISNWIHAVPLLQERGMTGIFFACTDFIVPGPVRSMSQFPDLMSVRDSFINAFSKKDYSQFMNEDELKALVHDKGMEVYSHTCRHQPCFTDMRNRNDFSEKSHWSAWAVYGEKISGVPVYSAGSAYVYNGFWPVFEGGRVSFKRRSDEERREFCRDEFSRSYEVAKKINGQSVQFLCWPWGHFDNLSMSVAAQCGYQGTFTLERTANVFGTNPMRINRIGVGRQKNADWIKKRLSMYSHEISARLCFKFFNKKNDISKVLYISDSMKKSGGSRQLVNSAAAMIASGIEVMAVLPPEAALTPELQKIGVEVVTLENYKNFLGAGLILAELIQDAGVDVVHTFHNRAVKAVCVAKCLCLASGFKFKAFFNRGVIYKPNPLAPLFALIGNGYISNSEKCRKVLRKSFVPEKRVHIAFNSFAAEDVAYDRNPAVTVVYAGNSAKVKGADVFAKCVERLLKMADCQNIRFIAVGVKNKNVLKPFVAAETIERIEFPGFVPHEKVTEILGRAHIYVMSSRQESMPNTLIEAFNAGLAAVCTDAGGTSELVKDGVNGFICPVEDDKSLSEKILRLINDPELRQKMGRINRKIVRERLDTASKAMNLLHIYSSKPGDKPIIPDLDIESLINNK